MGTLTVKGDFFTVRTFGIINSDFGNFIFRVQLRTNTFNGIGFLCIPVISAFQYSRGAIIVFLCKLVGYSCRSIIMTTIIISPVSTVDNTVVGICNKYLFVINNYSLVRAQGTCFPICCKIIVLVSIPLKMYPFPFTSNGSDFSTCTGFIVI